MKLPVFISSCKTAWQRTYTHIRPRIRRTYSHIKPRLRRIPRPWPLNRKTKSRAKSTNENGNELESNSSPLGPGTQRRRREINPTSQFWSVDEERDLQEMLANVAETQAAEETQTQTRSRTPTQPRTPSQNPASPSQYHEEREDGVKMERIDEGTRIQGGMRGNGRPDSMYWEFEARPHSHHVRPEGGLDWNQRPARWSSGPGGVLGAQGVSELE